MKSQSRNFNQVSEVTVSTTSLVQSLELGLGLQFMYCKQEAANPETMTTLVQMHVGVSCYRSHGQLSKTCMRFKLVM